jgi:7-carboxy-7-deazaguanine synthase
LAKTKESDKWGPASGEDLLAIIGRQTGLPVTW